MPRVSISTFYIDLIRRTISTGGNAFTQDHLAVVVKMVGDEAVGTGYSGVKHADDLVNASARGGSRFGSAANAYHQANKRAAANHGSKIAANLIKVLDGIDDTALATLKTLPTSQLDEALDSLARILNKGIDPEAMTRVLNNTRVYGTLYKQPSLIKDLDELVVNNVEGISDMVNALKSTGKSVRGVRYELEGAAYLIRNPAEGETVIEVTRKFLPGLKGGTDLDVVVLRDGQTEIFYQFKSSYDSFKSPMAGKIKAWISKVGEHLEISAREVISRGQVRYAVPTFGDVPTSLRKGEAISLKGLPDIPVKEIPMTQ